MVSRTSNKLVRELARQFKVVAIVGPRQSGKTTLARSVFKKKPYVTLEEPDTLQFATEDPRAFLEQFPKGAILDEIQRCPELFSYLQRIVDDRKATGQFILTGSQHFGLMQSITQTLAGRVGFLRLLPFSVGELKLAKLLPLTIEEAVFKGGYPPLYDQPVIPERWLDSYLATYVERDVRQLINIRDLSSFRRFTRLCAGNVGQLVNMSRIGADAGVDQKTVSAWISLLEASFVAFRLQPSHTNFRKRLVKTPKFYFFDTAVAARLLGIESPNQLVTHPLRGALFENWVVVELLKGRGNRGKQDNLSFWRSQIGQEVDIVAHRGQHLLPIEVKSGKTVASDWISSLNQFVEMSGKISELPTVVYGGDRRQRRSGIRVIPWNQIDQLGNNI